MAGTAELPDLVLQEAVKAGLLLLQHLCSTGRSSQRGGRVLDDFRFEIIWLMNLQIIPRTEAHKSRSR